APRGRIGFLANPFPNPSTGSVSFRIGVGAAGRAHAEVFDARGRLVVGLLDHVLPAGSQIVTWDGRASGGRHATPGVYYVSVQFAGFAGRKSFAHVRCALPLTASSRYSPSIPPAMTEVCASNGFCGLAPG